MPIQPEVQRKRSADGRTRRLGTTGPFFRPPHSTIMQSMYDKVSCGRRRRGRGRPRGSYSDDLYLLTYLLTCTHKNLDEATTEYMQTTRLNKMSATRVRKWRYAHSTPQYVRGRANAYGNTRARIKYINNCLHGGGDDDDAQMHSAACTSVCGCGGDTHTHMHTHARRLPVTDPSQRRSIGTNSYHQQHQRLVM